MEGMERIERKEGIEGMEGIEGIERTKWVDESGMGAEMGRRMGNEPHGAAVDGPLNSSSLQA